VEYNSEKSYGMNCGWKNWAETHNKEKKKPFGEVNHRKRIRRKSEHLLPVVKRGEDLERGGIHNRPLPEGGGRVAGVVSTAGGGHKKTTTQFG